MKNTLRNSLLLCGLLLAASMSFAQTILTRTTLASAVTSTSTTSIQLTSNTGLTAAASVIYVADPGASGEAMFVNAVSSSGGYVSVTRGYQTLGKARTHASGTVVFIIPNVSGGGLAINTIAPSGSCTRASELYLPVISVGEYGQGTVISDCLGGQWVNGGNTVTPTIVFSPAPGGAVLTGVGTSTTTTNTSMYCADIYLPANKLLTGLEILNGTAVGNGHRNAILYDASGTLLAQSGTTTTTASASTYQAYAFTSSFYAVGPAIYVGCSQAQNSSDSLNLVVTADGNAGLFTQIYTGQTYATVPATITAPTAYTTAQGPYFAFY